MDIWCESQVIDRRKCHDETTKVLSLMAPKAPLFRVERVERDRERGVSCGILTTNRATKELGLFFMDKDSSASRRTPVK
jgi:hypothetical protein